MADNVMLYSLSTCSHCNATKRLLSACQVEYVFKDVDLLDDQERKAILEDIRALNPECSFPTIVIGKRVIAGFNEKEIMAALDALQSPKTIWGKISSFFKKGN